MNENDFNQDNLKIDKEEIDKIFKELRKVKNKDKLKFVSSMPKKYIEELYKRINKSEDLFLMENQSESIINSDEESDLNCENIAEGNQSSAYLNITISNSKKPLWIEDVKKTCDMFIPMVDMKDIENAKDILSREDNEEIFVNLEDYPYFHTIKKLMYAFGDTYKNNSRTIIYIHDFVKKLLLILSKILNECEFKKVLEHLYSYEFHKFFNYKKLKFKNNFDVDEGGELQEAKKIEKIDPDSMQIEDIFEYSDNEKTYNKNCLEKIFEEKDDNYVENLEFQDQRTSSMNHTEYLEFISCRHQTFLSKGKKTFLNYLQNTLQNYFVFEFRDTNNLELVSFLLKEILRKIITNAIKLKHPNNERKLFILNFPLIIEDLEDQCNKEIEKLEIFLLDFSTDIYLMKEFKKKKFSKKNNKNVKIKRIKNEMVIVIKKYIYLDDEKEIEFLRKNKKKSEENVIVIQRKIIEFYSEILKYYKEKLEKNSKEVELKKTRNKSKISTTNGEDFLVSLISNGTPYNEITNFYEYFLLKDFIIFNIENSIKLLSEDTFQSLYSELEKKQNLIKKFTKKSISKKFDHWLNLTRSERNKIISDFSLFSE